jgi:hypothetical protein
MDVYAYNFSSHGLERFHEAGRPSGSDYSKRPRREHVQGRKRIHSSMTQGATRVRVNDFGKNLKPSLNLRAWASLLQIICRRIRNDVACFDGHQGAFNALCQSAFKFDPTYRRPASRGASSVCHGGRAQFGCNSARRRGRSGPPAVGAAIVLSYATLAEYFPKELAGRANGALNLFHIAAAFIVQYATGVVLQHRTPQAGHYPEIAYRTAFALNLALQIAAWVWFALPRVQILLRGAKAHAIQRSRPDPDGLLRSIHHNEIA